MATIKTLKRMLKKAGLKTTGKKAALTRRAKKARLMRGGAHMCEDASGNSTPHISKEACEAAGNTWKEVAPEMEAAEGGRRRH